MIPDFHFLNFVSCKSRAEKLAYLYRHVKKKSYVTQQEILSTISGAILCNYAATAIKNDDCISR
jgi:hypothetical protein